ncbi:MAG: efflux RND transporter permease subunit [Rhodanobacteraceae bacterium]|nr:efflux RND transporter permease subunit [Rhodanobacteraceae bacterium]
MTLAEIALKRPVTTIMLFISCVVFGLLSARLLKLEFFPEVDAPFILVQVPYPGATPKEVEREIVRPLEESLSTISGIDNMFANADENGATFFLVFDWNRNIKVKLSEVRERVDAARGELPQDIQRILVQKFSTNDEPVLQVRLSSTTGNLLDAYDLLERRIKRPLERIPGVAAVELSGVEPSEVRIDLLPERIAAHNIDLNALSQKLQSANFSTSAGLIHDGEHRYRVQPIGEIRDLSEYGNLIIGEGGLRLKDIAEVRYAQREINFRRILNGNYAVGVDIRRERGANLVDVCSRVMAEIRKIEASGALAGIEIYIIGDQGEGVTSSMGELVKAGWEGMLFSLLVLYFFLRHWPSTLMVSLSVPICIAISLGGLYFIGLTLNVLTMMGLLLGIGMLVDNAVVVTESIYQQREKRPEDKIGTAIEGTRMVQLAVSAGTLTSIIVFLPNVFGGTTQVGLFLYYVAVPMSVALLASWFVAVSIIPMLAARIEPPKGLAQVQIVERWKAVYGRTLRWSLQHRGWSWVGILGILFSVAIPGAFVKTDFFGGDADRDFAVGYELNGRYRLEQMEQAARTVEEYLLRHKQEFEIESVYSWISEDQGMQTRLQLVKGEDAKRPVEEIKEAVRKGLPQLAVGKAVVDLRFGPGGGNAGGGSQTPSVQVNITGDSTEVLTELARDVTRLLARNEMFADVRVDNAQEQQEVQLRVDRERAANLGFDPAQVGRLIQVAMRGVPLREFRQGDTEVPVWLRFKDAERLSLDELKVIRVTRADGESVPLSALVSVDMSPGPTGIGRQNRKTGTSITLDLKPKSDMGEARQAIESTMKEYPFPAGYGYDLGQRFEDDAAAANEMLFLLLLSIVLIYMVMAALFESALYPLAILTSIIFAVIGVWWTFLVWDTTFSVMAFIGIMILIGVVVNNGIVLIEHVNTLRRQGYSRDEALILGGVERLRPILITTGTTFLGLLPLCISDVGIGGGGPAYYPMARAIAGGLVFSTAITLLVLPTMYAAVEDLGERVKGHWRRAGGQPAMAVEA